MARLATSRQPEIKEAMEIWVSGPSLPPEERIEAGKRLWVLFAENVWQAGIVGSSPAVLGTRIVKDMRWAMFPRGSFPTCSA